MNVNKDKKLLKMMRRISSKYKLNTPDKEKGKNIKSIKNN